MEGVTDKIEDYMNNIIQYDGIIERIHWFVRLRWIAIVGVALTISFADNILGISIASFPLYSIIIFLGLYNVLFAFHLNNYRNKKTIKDILSVGNRIANAQISLDVLSLVALIHFSGGIENPFIFYFIFHIIIASILLSRRASFLQATLVVFLFCSMVFLEYFGILPHYCLKGFITYDLHNNLIYIGGITSVFISTLYIAAYMATSISIKLRQREKSLKEANELLLEQDRLKSEYVLRVTHDIKEHLSAIQSCIEPVTEGFLGQLNPKQTDLLKRAVDRCAKLLAFVKALLEISRIKLSKHIQMEFFSVNDVVNNAIGYVEAKAKSKDIAIHAKIESTINQIRGAHSYIEETISNILANAVKYTPKGGKIYLEVTDKSESILIQIRDTGIGIPKDELPKVFDEFYRATNAREVERDGTGMGLSIAKQVVERHKGKIWVESVEGKGSTFYIILPK